MTGEDIADGVVALLNAIAAPSQAFTAVNAENPNTAREVDGLTVQVWPYALTEEEIDRAGGWQVTCEVQIIVQAPLTASRGRSEMMTLLTELREALRGSSVAGARHRSTEVLALWDGEAERNRKQYVGSMRASYEAIE